MLGIEKLLEKGKHLLSAATVGKILSLVLGLWAGFHFLGKTAFITLAVITALLTLYKPLAKSAWCWLFKLLFRVDVKGMSNYELAGENTIILANYNTKLDLLLLSLFLPGDLVVATKKGRGLWAKLSLLFVDVIAIDPLSMTTPRFLVKALKQGKRCIVFPEKTFAEHRTSLSAFEGIGLVMDKAKSRLLPIQISGTNHLFFARKNGLNRKSLLPKITIDIKAPQYFEAPKTYTARQKRHFYALKAYTVLQMIHFASAKVERTLFEALLDARSLAGGKFELCEDVQRTPITYNDIVIRSFLLGDIIASQTVSREVVGVLLPTTTTALITFFALQAFGRLPAMLNFSGGLKAIDLACKTGKIKTIYTSKQFIATAKLESLISGLEEKGLNIVYLESFKEQVTLKKKIKAFVQSVFARTFYKRLSQHVKYYQPAAVLFTSGSEGAPKGVVLSHKNLLANCAQITESVDFTKQDKIFSALPVFHCFGLTVGALLPVIHSVPCFFYPSPLHYRIIPNLVEETKSTIMLGTDTFLNGYAKYAKTGQFRQVRYLFAGAEKLKEKTREYWASHLGVCISQGYGATEASPVISTNTMMKQKNDSVGCLLPGIESQLRPVEGVKQGGRLWIKGPNVMMGYMEVTNPGSLKPLCDGWYDTGDIVDIDERGFISILGRAKRFAKIGGEMISLAYVEDLASQTWPAGVHAAIALPDEKKGEKIILLTDVADASREALLEKAKAFGIAELVVPKTIRILSEIPVLATGKINYNSLKKEEETDGAGANLKESA